ncbi:MAG: bacterioferritin [Gammaproteobacteria bacterium]|nr:bacterioferritin [Gammaproteobacteria bacterium]
MTQDPVVLGYLGRGLSFELSAVQQYMSLAKLLELRGMPQAGKKFRHEAMTEMEHVERLIGRMLALGVSPNTSCLKRPRLNGALPELIKHIGDLEGEIINFYEQAVLYCSQRQDHENRIFFAALLKDEQQHATELNSWWQSIMEEKSI